MPAGEFATTKMFKKYSSFWKWVKIKHPRKPNPVIYKDAHTLSSQQDGSEGKVFSTKPNNLYLIPGRHVDRRREATSSGCSLTVAGFEEGCCCGVSRRLWSELFGALLLYSILATAMKGLSEFLNDPN